MDWLTAVILALVQGLTEFLPISSSAHLILAPRLFGWPDQGLAFDVAVHFGTLLAVVIYFRHELQEILVAFVSALGNWENRSRDADLGLMLIIASMPVVLVGLLAHDFIAENFRSPLIIGFTTAFFGLLLWWSDRDGGGAEDEYAVGPRRAVLVGLAQVLALIPGTSRSGITMTAGLALGLNRRAAARFSFLLSIPTIAGAAFLELTNLLSARAPVDWSMLALGLGAAFVSAYVCIRLFLATIERIGMLPFVFYRIALAAVIVYVFV
jgi:undecaprenyl-diphosphatase